MDAKGGRETPENMHTYGAHDNGGPLMGSKGKVPTGLNTSTLGDKVRSEKNKGWSGSDRFFPGKTAGKAKI